MLLIALYVLYIFIAIVLFLICFILLRRFFMQRKERHYNKCYQKYAEVIEKYIAKLITDEQLINSLSQKRSKYNSYILLKVILDYKHIWKRKLSEAILKDIQMIKLIRQNLRSKFSWQVVLALNTLTTLDIRGFTFDVEKLLKHKDELVIHTAIEYLLKVHQYRELERMIMLLARLDDWYLEHYIELFARQQAATWLTLLELFHVKEFMADKVCILKILKRYHIPEVQQLFTELLVANEAQYRELAAEYFLDKDPDIIIANNLNNDLSPYVRSLYFKAMRFLKPNQQKIQLLLEHGNDKFQVIRRQVTATLTYYCQESQHVVDILQDKLLTSNDYDNTIVKVFELSGITEFFIRDLDSQSNSEVATQVLTKVIKQKDLGTVFRFLIVYKNNNINNKLTKLLLLHAEREQLALSLDMIEKVPEQFRKPLLANIEISNQQQKQQAQEQVLRQKNYKLRVVLLAILFFILLIPLTITGTNNLYFLLQAEYKLFLANMIRDFNINILYYVGAINSFYLVLAIISLVGLVKYNNRKRAWLAGEYLKRKVTPAISLIAPCYNEEATVIQSVNSLLTIRYPNYEVVVINDGSKDHTLATLIEYFDLELVVPQYTELLQTATVRNVYKSRKYKKLVVVDKENGGKADALNAGINISSYPLFCAIDADTLIEGDSLINAAAPFSFDHFRTVATGGNIRVINNCKIIEGEITEQALPKRVVESLQVLEYIRAFIGGRVGWSYLNNLLIISGAFGLFKKKEAFAIGGYSTLKSRDFHTVGEDMELVVSYHKHCMNQKKDYKITYCHDANGWTEVPSDLKTLRKQRNRWHRGLLEVLVDNIQMILPTKYRKINPSYWFFFVFEMVGPWIEVIGYVFVLIAALIGILDPVVAVMLFSLSVLYGIIISLFSLYLEEKEVIRYRFTELLKLIFYAIVENFGFRQLSVFWRTGAYLSLIFNKQGWGTMKRKGFF